MTKYARLTEADDDNVRHVIEVLNTDQPLAEVVHPSLIDQWTEVPAETTQWSTLQGSTWTHTPPPEAVEPDPVDPPPAPLYYLPKVTLERRLPEAVFNALDSLRVQVDARPVDWPTTTDEPWATLRPYIRPMLDYKAAERVAVQDPALSAVLQTLQAQSQVFGADPVEAQAAIALVLTPGPLAGEPTT